MYPISVPARNDKNPRIIYCCLFEVIDMASRVYANYDHWNEWLGGRIQTVAVSSDTTCLYHDMQLILVLQRLTAMPQSNSSSAKRRKLMLTRGLTTSLLFNT